VSVLISVIGHVVLVCSAIPSLIDHSGRSGAMAVYIIGMLIMGIGTGGFKVSFPLITRLSGIAS